MCRVVIPVRESPLGTEKLGKPDASGVDKGNYRDQFVHSCGDAISYLSDRSDIDFRTPMAS